MPRTTRDVPLDLVLNPAARLLWRGDRCVQLELGRRAVVVDGLAADEVRRLTARQLPEAPLSTDTADAMGALLDAGFVWPRTAVPDDARQAPPVPRLAAELEALSARRGEQAAETLAARRSRAVAVEGTGRLAAPIAALLAASGIGRVTVLGDGDVRLHQAVPGGVAPADEGRGFRPAALDAVTRAAPDVVTDPLPLGDRPDLVVLAGDVPPEPDRRDGLHAQQAAHLAVRLDTDHGAIGPLVIPGLTSCLRCADLHRADRDPAWPALAAQLAVPRRAGAASPVAAAGMLAGLAALQVLAFLDGEHPAVIDGTLELQLPGWRVRRRSWRPHPRCDCGC